MQELDSNKEFTPGQYVRVRSTAHEPWQVRIFVGWNDRRPGSGAIPYARVMLSNGFQFDADAPCESFSLIEAWRPEIGQWVWDELINSDKLVKGEIGFVWAAVPVDSNMLYDAGEVEYQIEQFIFGDCIAPLTLPPFIAPGDKY